MIDPTELNKSHIIWIFESNLAYLRRTYLTKLYYDTYKKVMYKYKYILYYEIKPLYNKFYKIHGNIEKFQKKIHNNFVQINKGFKFEMSEYMETHSEY